MIGLHDLKATLRLREARAMIHERIGDAYPIIEPGTEVLRGRTTVR